MSGLKAGWRRVRFGDVVRLNRDRSKDPAADGLTRAVGLEHIDPEDLTVRRWGDSAEKTFTNRFRPGQVLFGKRRAYQRKVAVADFEGVCSGDIYVFEPKDPSVLLPELLPFICQTEAFFAHAVGTSAGSLSPRTNWKSLAVYEFALPPLAEQRRLVRVLALVQARFESAQTVASTAESLRRSFLIRTFRPNRGKKDHFPDDWRYVLVTEAGEVQVGQRRAPSYRSGKNIRPYLRAANVLDGRLRLHEVLTQNFPTKHLDKTELQSGDILLCEGQSLEFVGRSAIFRGEIDGCCVQNTLIRFRCRRPLLPEFAQAYFQHCLYSGQFARYAVQTTSMAHLTVERFRKMKMPVAPSVQQAAVVQQLSAIESAKEAATRKSEASRELLLVSIREVLG